MNASPPLPTTPEDIGRRILRWVADLRGPDDLLPDGIERALGVPVVHAPDGSGAYGIGNRIDDRWNYTLRTLAPSDADAGHAPRMLFSFDDQTGRFDDFAPVCALDFDAYATELRNAGYVAAFDLGPRDALNGVVFRRDTVEIRMQLRAENDGHPDHLCVAALLVDVSGGDHA